MRRQSIRNNRCLPMTRRALLLLVLACPPRAPGLRRRRARGRAARDDRVAVALDDFRYRPQTIRAAPGRAARRPRQPRPPRPHVPRSSAARPIVAKVSSLLPGDRARKTVRVRKGEYRFFCALSNHEELGMYGTLVVK